MKGAPTLALFGLSPCFRPESRGAQSSPEEDGLLRSQGAFLLTEEACPDGAAVVARWPVRLGLPRQLEQAAAVPSRTGEGSCATGPIEEEAAAAAARVPQPPPILPRGPSAEVS